MPVEDEGCALEFFGTTGRLYSSTCSNAKLVHFKIPGTISKAAITVPTATLNDEGLPHTLEHLIFTASDKYPKGYLDPISQLHVSEGTNAYTYADRTVYTFQSCSSEAVVKFLYIYMDHILRPKWDMKEFYSQVHHVGEDYNPKGVVYTEMADCSKEPIECILCRKHKALYSPLSPYAYNYGGDPLKIPQLTNEKIKNFHKSAYAWDRLTITMVLHEDVPVSTLKEFYDICEAEYYDSSLKLPELDLDAGSKFGPPCGRPMAEGGELIHMKHSAEKEESQISVCELAWRGPKYDEVHELDMIDVLGEYLTDNMNSPLYTALVLDENLCSDVEFSLTNYYVSNLGISCNVLAENKEDKIVSVTLATIKRIIDEGFDMRRLKSCIFNFKVSRETAHEYAPQSEVHTYICDWAVFSRATDEPDMNKKYLQSILDVEERFSKLMSLSVDKWKHTLERYFIPDNLVVLVSYPSTSEEEIIQYQKDKLRGNNSMAYSLDDLQEIQSIIHEPVPNMDIDELRKFEQPKRPIKSYSLEYVSNMSLATLPLDLVDTMVNNIEVVHMPPRVINALQAFADASPVPIIFQTTKSQTSTVKMVIPFTNNTPDRYGIIKPPSQYSHKSNTYKGMLDISAKKTMDDDDKLASISNMDMSKLNSFLPNLYFATALRDGTSYTEVIDTLHQLSADVVVEIGKASTRNAIIVGLNCIKEFQIQAFDLLIRSILLMRLTKKSLLTTVDHMYAQVLQEANTPECQVEDVSNSIIYPLEHIINGCGMFQQKDILKKIRKDPRTYVKIIQVIHDRLVCAGSHTSKWTTDQRPKLVLHVVADFDMDDASLTFFLNSVDSTMQKTINSLQLNIQSKTDVGKVNQTVNLIKKGGIRMASSMRVWRGCSGNAEHYSSLNNSSGLSESSPVQRESPRAIFGQLYGQLMPIEPLCISSIFKHNTLDPGLRNRNDVEPLAMNIAVPNIKSSCFHLVQKVRVQTTRDKQEKDRATLMVLCAYLSHGPLFQNLRGPGYTYGACISLSDANTTLTLDIGPANSMAACMSETFKLFDECISGKTSVDEILLRGRNISLFFEAYEHPSQFTASHEMVLNAVRGRPIYYKSMIIENLFKVTVEDLRQCIQLYIPKFRKLARSIHESELLETSMSCVLVGPSVTIEDEVEKMNKLYEQGTFEVVSYENISMWLTCGQKN